MVRMMVLEVTQNWQKVIKFNLIYNKLRKLIDVYAHVDFS